MERPEGSGKKAGLEKTVHASETLVRLTATRKGAPRAPDFTMSKAFKPQDESAKEKIKQNS